MILLCVIDQNLKVVENLGVLVVHFLEVTNGNLLRLIQVQQSVLLNMFYVNRREIFRRYVVQKCYEAKLFEERLLDYIYIVLPVDKRELHFNLSRDVGYRQ